VRRDFTGPVLQYSVLVVNPQNVIVGRSLIGRKAVRGGANLDVFLGYLP
jgi:hypothetical protein